MFIRMYLDWIQFSHNQFQFYLVSQNNNQLFLFIKFLLLFWSQNLYFDSYSNNTLLETRVVKRLNLEKRGTEEVGWGKREKKKEKKKERIRRDTFFSVFNQFFSIWMLVFFYYQFYVLW